METNGCNEFPYRPLLDRIRLLKISKGRDSSTILGLLEDFSLNSLNCPRFIAVSYIWGSGERSESILLNSVGSYSTRNIV
jgi:hypothetical protein